jgi:hypothetical protein
MVNVTWLDSAGHSEYENGIVIFDRGKRYAIGYGPDYCAVWDERGLGKPEISRWPKTDEGWSSAFARYARLESRVLGHEPPSPPQPSPPTETPPAPPPARGAWRSPRPPRPPRAARPQSALPAQGPRPVRGHQAEYLLFAIGGVLLAGSAFLPWLTTSSQTYSLFSLAGVNNGLPLLPALMVALGITIALFSLRRWTITKLSWLAGATTMGLLVFGGVDLVTLFRSAVTSGGAASLGVGMFATVVGAALLAIGSIRVHREESGQ